jgi:hypothetical protein
MSSSSLLETRNPDDFTILYVKRAGMAQREDNNRRMFTLHMEAKEPIERRYEYELEQFLRLYLYAEEDHMSRFVDGSEYEDWEYHIPKQITGGKFALAAEWIHTQTQGPWSLTVIADKRKRPKHSFMMIHFRDQNDALFFKMFEEDIVLSPQD